MDVSQIKIEQLYNELKIELKICKIGGLFVVLYKDEAIPEIIINRLRKDLPDQFLFSLYMDERKVPFSIFFGQSLEQMGKQSNIFHVIGIEKLPNKSIIDFIRYLQYGRERFKSKSYSIVFWVSTEFEKQLFHLAPDFHHWVFGTYDFTQIDTKIFDSY